MKESLYANNREAVPCGSQLKAKLVPGGGLLRISSPSPRKPHPPASILANPSAVTK